MIFVWNGMTMVNSARGMGLYLGIPVLICDQRPPCGSRGWRWQQSAPGYGKQIEELSDWSRLGNFTKELGFEEFKCRHPSRDICQA